jgi:hypothetical protein
VRVLRFHRDLYPGELLDEAIKVYEPFAKLRRSEDSSHWVVTLDAQTEARERRVGGELGNYALGLTVQKRAPRRERKD